MSQEEPRDPESHETDTGEINLRSAGYATRWWAWSFIGFASVFMLFAGVDMALEGKEGTLTATGLLAGLFAAGVVGIWPRPRFMRQFRIDAQGIHAVDWFGRNRSIPTSEIEILSIEGFFDLQTLSFENWGRLNVRSGREWWAIQLNRTGMKQIFFRVLNRFPGALGISGDQEVTVPALLQVENASEWIDQIRTRCRRELGRQVRYAAFFSIALAAGALILFKMATSGLGGFPRFFRHSGLELAALLGAASVAFALAAVRRHNFRARVLAQIKAAEPA